jgi:hypothetical protein
MSDSTVTTRDFDWAALVKQAENRDNKPVEKPIAYIFSNGRKFVQEEFTGNYTPV